MSPQRYLAFALILAAALAGSISASRTASAHQYIVNGSFEDGTTAWSILSEGSSFDTAPDDVAPFDGAYRGRVVLGQPNFRVNQSIGDVPPGSYRISMSVRVESTNAIVRLDIVTNPARTERFSTPTFTPTPGEWQHVDAEVGITGASWVNIRLVGAGNVGDRIYIDRVAFEGAPPATMTPTQTHTPLPSTNTPLPPTPTKTTKATSTTSPVPTSTAEQAPQNAISVDSLMNGGFEDVVEGLPSSWSKYGGSLSVTASPVRTGAHAGKLESATDSTKWLFQTVAVSGGSSYAFEAWLWHDDPNVASAFLRVSWYASADSSGEAIGTADSATRIETASGEWRFLTTSGITAPPEARTAKLRIMLQPSSATPAVIYADDAAFVPADLTLGSAPQAPGSADQSAEGGAPLGAAPSDNPAQRQSLLSGDTVSAKASRIVISEVLYDSLEAQDADGEWIELYNAGLEPVALEGWTIADNKYGDSLAPFTLDPAAYIIIVASDSLYATMTQNGIPAIRVAGNIGNSLNNSGDVVALIDPSGQFADAVSWGDNSSAFDPPITDVPTGHSIERRSPRADTDSAFDFVDNERPSPGEPYAAATDISRPAAANGSDVQVLVGESGGFFSSIMWLLVAASMGVLATVAAARLGPIVTQRLRHQ